MRRPLLSLLMSFFVISISLNTAGQSDPQSGTSIKGKVVDSDNDMPLEFAAISVHDATDSTLTTGSVTDIDGKFRIPVKPGNYLLKVEYISYKTQWIDNIEVTNGATDLGAIGLAVSAATLQEVEVTGEKSQFQLGLDKKIFNVGKDLVTRSGSAADILDNIPSVTVDLEGNVSLRGSQNVRILIDGRPSGLVGLSGNDALRSLQGDLIERVEVVTNPSARYDAEGMAGIINIILKKERRDGFHGSFSGFAGYPDNYGGSANVNYRKKDVNLFLNYGIRYRESPGGGALFQEYYLNDTTTYLDQTRDRTRSDWSQNVRFGTDIFFSDNDILTGSFLYRISHDENTQLLVYNDLDEFRQLQSISTREEFEEEEEPTLEYSLNYQRKMGKDHEFTASMQYQESTEKESADYSEKQFNPDMTPGEVPDLKQRSNNEEGQLSWLAQVDYVRPVGENGKFEAGYRGSFRDINNDYLVEEFADNEWIRLDGLSNDFRYDEDIHAGYVMYGNKFGAFSYQAGLRLEYSHVVTRLIETNEINDRDYTNLFPSIHLGYETKDQNTVQLSYSRRISRPRFWYLNPFFSYSDSRNFWGGNPNLDPEYTNAYELGYIKYWDNASLSSSVYHRHSTDVIQRIREIDEQGVTTTIPRNLATQDDFGFEFTFSRDMTEEWKVDGNLNFFRSITKGGVFGDADTYSWQSRLNSRLTIFKDVETQLRFNYRGPRETTQGRAKSMYHMDIGISKDIMNNNATITLNVRDVFNSRKWRYITEGIGFRAEGEFQWRARQLTVDFTYRLNQKKQRERNRDRGDFEGGEGEF